MKLILHVELELPPSSNNIYFSRNGARVLTAEARSWKKRAIAKVVKDCGLGLQPEMDCNAMYAMATHFWFPTVTNKGWFETFKKGKDAGKRKANSKWKRMDLSNRLKLLEDAIKDATGIDDSSTFIQILVKDQDTENPHVGVDLMQLQETDPWPTKKP